jgi:hypothetical protein
LFGEKQFQVIHDSGTITQNQYLAAYTPTLEIPLTQHAQYNNATTTGAANGIYVCFLSDAGSFPSS